MPVTAFSPPFVYVRLCNLMLLEILPHVTYAYKKILTKFEFYRYRLMTLLSSATL